MAQEAQRTCFVNVLARMLFARESTKPIFRRPFIRYGRLLPAAGYCFQVSGILACRFRNHAQPFVTVFASSTDSATTVQVMTTEWGAVVASQITPACSILDYVVRSEIHNLKFKADRGAFYLKYTGAKVACEKAVEILRDYALNGVALGLRDPDQFRGIFERSHSSLDEVSRIKWDRARAAGVDIPEGPDALDYAGCEADSVEMFSEYCRQMYPDLAPSLGL